MIIHFMIKNFGKIESADIALNDLVVFIGNNNSGKTMVMQLIYGIRKELKRFQVPISGARHTQLNDQYLIRCDQKWFKEVETQVNQYLTRKKLQIIEDIFGIPVSCEEIIVELEDTENTYFVSSFSGYRNRGIREEGIDINIDTRQYENGENTRSFEHQISSGSDLETAIKAALQMVWNIVLSDNTASDAGQLFLPASRSGLQLLYKHYFATEAAGNLVMPIKEFLRFLQLYTENPQLRESRSALLEFGEEHLLEGKMIQKGDETFYVENYGTREISLHIASSMIHELTPFIKALNATQKIDWLYCDEVENSLHPLLQGEMARWLIRMVNADMDQTPEYETIPDLGVITRTYDEQRMIRLRNDYREQCHTIENNHQGPTLAQRKKRPDIAKYKGVLKVAQAILDGEFQTEDGTGTYKIHIRRLSKETDLIYKIRLLV